MAKPVVLQIGTYDATSSATVKFTYGGNQVYKNKLTIYDADTLAEVYTNTVSSMICQNTIAANVLTNGKKYAAEIICYDKYGTASSVSDKSFFWVMTKPTFTFTNITSGQTINSSTKTVDLDYAQSEWCKLEQYQFLIYDNDKNLINSSEVMYDYSDPCTYDYKGLDNATTYYFRAIGQTDKGVVCDTGYFEVFTKYKNPTMYALVYATSDDTGTVEGYTNFKIIPATRNDYTYKDGFIQLQDDVVIYNTEINFSGELLFGLKFRNTVDGQIFLCENSENQIIITQITDGDDSKVRFRLKATNSFSEYIIYSDPNEIYKNDVVTLWFERVDNIYKMKVLVKSS